MEETEEEKPKKKKKEFELIQVPTQHTIAVQTPEGEIISTEQLLVQIANDLVEIKKGVIG